ncbi:hypothetical protein OOT00_03400 [Desulfobotulus sp. H1]|uniref:Uncharacterized protein n=1 Tax=Desulfobotulus pelophilus TaxID=2823377 RepID=A0ABT3N6E2_9BACT|nr:hypothetical protein [Desulfobotulus pelophilus]MCW7753028.1 hypothetical protein [Desulfobotulus pelophilus]
MVAELGMDENWQTIHLVFFLKEVRNVLVREVPLAMAESPGHPGEDVE